MINVFERTLLPNEVYPCTTEDIRQRLTRIPTIDLEGLWAVGLISSTRKDNNSNGRYIPGRKPVIHLLSYPETLAYKLFPHTKYSEIESGLAVELKFGMRVEQIGSRWMCTWDKESLRQFTLEHVLLHELGHHVYYRQRIRTGVSSFPAYHVGEQFAEAYALRHEHTKHE